ncbi:hypothetical protein K435DRAFT_841923 [Dendrothele bispora CBS 962.96]|uniref:Uncharacterized protein n=1 Tax=Dendrothele bispora (strain CBS 962.96) TaxID=1314807 RepID=A0A4V4HE31_DENBC|nr:hypothetical protein K435DRAFT_841923 [Dendrothele bispora CBS 962.96]
MSDTKTQQIIFTTDDMHSWQDFLQSIAFEGIQCIFFIATLHIFSFITLGANLCNSLELQKHYSGIMIGITYKGNTYYSSYNSPDISKKIHTFLCGDAVVVWRAWILFNRGSKYRLFLGFCMITTFAASIADSWIQMTNSQAEDAGWAWIILPIGLVFTNLAATLLIAIKAWHYRHFLRENQIESPGKGQIEKFFVLLIESGGAYCLLWILGLIQLQLVYGIMQAAAPDFIGTDVVAGLGPHISCLYLLSIIILTANHKTHCDSTLQRQSLSQSVQFAPPPGSRLIDSVSDHQLAPREIHI